MYNEHIVPIRSKRPLFKKLILIILILRHTTSRDHIPDNDNYLSKSHSLKSR